MSRARPGHGARCTAHRDGARTAALAGLGAALLVATRQVHLTGDLALANRRYLAIFAVMLALAGLGARLGWRRARRRDVAIVLAVALAARLLVAFDVPTLSDDAYRFVWDGRVQAAGINPYAYAPAAPALLPLRDWKIFTEVNRPFVRTLYPPVDEIAFYAINRVLGEGVVAVKLAWLGLEALVVALLALILRRSGRSLGRLALYAWHPLTVIEIAGSGHPDPLLVAPTLAALLLWDRRRFAGAGVTLALAALTRWVPILMAPFMLRRGRGRLAIAFAATAVAAYLPYADAGPLALGSLERFGQESFGSGPFRWLVATGMGALGARILLLGALAAAVAWSAARPPRDLADACRHSGLLMGGALLASWQVQPWYLIWVLPFACVVAVPGLLWASATASAFYLTFGPAKVAQGWEVALVVWAPAVALLALDALRAARASGHERIGAGSRPSAPRLT